MNIMSAIDIIRYYFYKVTMTKDQTMLRDMVAVAY